MLQQLAPTLAITLFLLLSGCDGADPANGDEDSDLAPGQAQIAITGDIEASYSGEATFFTSTDPTQPGVSIRLGNLQLPDGQVWLTGRFEVEPGTYPVSDDDNAIVTALYLHPSDNSDVGGINGVAGTLTISSETSTSLSGSITFNGDVMSESGSGEVLGQAAVEAVFNASRIN